MLRASRPNRNVTDGRLRDRVQRQDLMMNECRESTKCGGREHGIITSGGLRDGVERLHASNDLVAHALVSAVLALDGGAGELPVTIRVHLNGVHGSG